MGDLPDLLTTERLRLPVVTAEQARAIVDGPRQPSWDPDFPREDDRDGLSMVASLDDPSWGSRLVVRAHDDHVAGTIGFYGPPADVGGVPETEVGFGLVPSARGRGVATEALRALLVETDRLGVRLRASVEPENTASLRVLAKAGFTELRGSDDEGRLVMARPLA